jgi:hypothetical protein
MYFCLSFVQGVSSEIELRFTLSNAQDLFVLGQVLLEIINNVYRHIQFVINNLNFLFRSPKSIFVINCGPVVQSFIRWVHFQKEPYFFIRLK